MVSIFPTTDRPVRSSISSKSVKVPPMSTPMRWLATVGPEGFIKELSEGLPELSELKFQVTARAPGANPDIR